MPHAEVLDVTDTSEIMAGMADAPASAGAVNSAHLEPPLTAEVCKLDEEGRRLQMRASRLARDARPEFEAWFEAGLLLRRASARLAEIVRRPHDDVGGAGLADLLSPVAVGGAASQGEPRAR